MKKNLKKKIKKSYGLNLKLEMQHRKPKDWIFGATSLKCIAEIPQGERTACLPEGEKQNIGEEKMDCATRAPINILETKFNWLLKNNKLSQELITWLSNKGYINEAGKIEFSDRFIAIKSGTTSSGNSLIAPLDAIRKNGLIPKNMFPQVSSFDEYHNSSLIIKEMENLGQEFLMRFGINYERVSNEQFSELLKRDILDLAGYAWPTPINGEYPRVEYPFNHAFVGYEKPDFYIFDNYIDSIDGDFNKKLAPNYRFLEEGYRTIISIKNSKANLTWWQIIIGFFGRKKVL